MNKLEIHRVASEFNRGGFVEAYKVQVVLVSPGERPGIRVVGTGEMSNLAPLA